MVDPFPVVAGRGGDEQGDAAVRLVTPSKLRTVAASMLNRTGHARFRRGPVVVRETVSCTEEEAEAAAAAAINVIMRCDGFSASASSSFPSSVTGVTGEGSVSNGRALLLAAGRHSAGGDKRNGDEDGGERCHCSKKRKSSWRARRRIRVPAISSRNADIPADDYSWRKYGQKPIKGSPYPRGYYKCSTVRGCLARKHVERDPGEPAMLIVTYDGDHRHGERPDSDGAQQDVRLIDSKAL